MSKRVHREVVDYLTDELLPFRKICVELARYHPTIFVRLADKVTGKDKDKCIVPPASTKVTWQGYTFDTSEPWHVESMAALKRGGFVEAIKIMRQATHIGLKEAKEYMDMIRSKW